MNNPLTTYHDIGEKAGRAMRKGDAGLFQHLSRHYVAMYNAERVSDRKAAEAAYKAGYKGEMLPHVAGL